MDEMVDVLDPTTGQKTGKVISYGSFLWFFAVCFQWDFIWQDLKNIRILQFYLWQYPVLFF